MDLHKSARKQELVSAVVDLCTRLGADVVAEGIETLDEYVALMQTGAKYGQGYLFARPAFPPPKPRWPPRPDEVTTIVPPTMPST
jgi:EAL domain-containing protein (putative c-di-GMP-specific phosphodiesterase class I)